MKTISIDRDIYDYLLSKASSADEPVSAILRRELHLEQPTIEIDDDTFAYLLSQARDFGESASDVLRRTLNLGDASHDPNPAPEGPIVFHIPAGTGASPWNTRETAVVATVGDTLRIVNDDATPHRLHTSGSPFAHPASDIDPGGTADFLLQRPFDGGQPLYDHDSGEAAEFWISVRPR